MIWLPLLLVALIGLARPRLGAVGVIFAVVVFDNLAVDLFAPIGVALYHVPPSVAAMLPATMAPVGFYAILVSARLALTPSPDRLALQQQLPGLARLVPFVILVGVLWGAATGGALNLAYHELRGVLVALAVFVAVRAVRPFEGHDLRRLVIGCTSGLALVTLLRFLFVTRGRYGGADAPFAHESVIFLAIGMVVAILGFVQAPTMRHRVLFALYALILLAATVATGRRSGTLVLIVGMTMIAILSLSHRPLWVVVVSSICVVIFGAYLAAFWNSSGSGALSQPARAIRSQFVPDQRDLNSDTYRLVETYNVTSTIRSSPLLGVGLGRPFLLLSPLWVAPNWSLQFYTPHDNLLWVWLKFGLPGLAVIGGVWAIAMGNVLRAARARIGSIPTYPVALAASMAVYLQFMQVDVMTTERAMIPFAVILALALSIPATVAETAPAHAAAPVSPERAPVGRRPHYFPGVVT